MRFNKKSPLKSDKKPPSKAPKKGVVGYNKKTALLEEAITQMNEGKYGRSSAALKELLALDPLNTEARRLFATLHLRLGSLISARTAFESLAREALDRQDFWLAESLLREYLTAGPRCVPFLEMLGQVYEQKGDLMAAVAEYGKAIEVLVEDPDSDHPDRAPDLFAKIRSLAAGSPEAMRLASLFDSETGQLLSPPAVSNAIVSEEPQPVESISIAGDSTPISAEPSQSSADQATEPEAIAIPEAPAAPEAPPALPEQSFENAPRMAIDTASADTTGEQVPNIRETAVDEKQVSAVQQTDDPSPPVLTTGEAPNETPDPPLKLADEAATTAAPVITSDVDQISIPPPDATEFSSGKDAEPASPVLIESIAVPDLSLHEVTQPISEAPSSPISMPWDQVQDTTLSIPLPSVESEGAQTPAETPDHTDGQSIPDVTGMADEQPTLPVQPESLLSSMSWEEILAEIGKGPDIPLAAEAAAATPHDHTEQIPVPILDHPALTSKDPVLTPISEPVAEEQILPAPMPWDQVEEGPVPILAHEPEPEFGIVPAPPLPPLDKLETSLSHDLKSDANDGTLAIEGLAATPPAEQEQVLPASGTVEHHEPLQEPFAEPSGEQSLDESYRLPPVGEEDLSAPAVPFEPPSSPSIEEPIEEPEPVQSVTEEVPPPEIAKLPDEPAMVTDPPVAPVDEPPVLHSAAESVSPETGQAATAAAAEAREVSDNGATVLQPASPDIPPASSEPFVPTPTPPEPAIALEEAVAASQPIQNEPTSIAQKDQPPAGINILWDERSGQSLSGQAKTGLLSRWLRKPKQDEPAAPTESADSAPSEPGQASLPDMSPVAFEQKERFTQEATIPVIAASDLLRNQPAGSLADGGEAKLHKKTNARKSSVASLSDRITTGAGRFISRCFSTTRSIIVSFIALVAAIIVSGLAAVGMAALIWVLMEERPSTAFHNLTATPQRTLQETGSNGYLALLGFDRGGSQDAAQAGFARKFEKSDLAMAATCLMSSGQARGRGGAEGEGTLAGWYHDPDPAARFRAQTASLRSWVTQADRSMARYKQWLTMPFEDWGYGEPMSPNCPIILHTHRLYVADELAKDLETGIDRLAADLAMWRNVMAQAKSLSIKMLAVNAVDDDTAIVSGLLGRPDVDERLVTRLAKMARPLDHGELSLRWPMQSELKAAEKIQNTILKSGSGATPFYVSVVSMMPLPTQKRLNSYADYYEASGKAPSEKGFAGLPKRAGFVRYPVQSWLDYGLNPIENILGVPPLPEWETYGGRILELDAKLRLASLQAWIRRSPPEHDIPTRMAKAGQALYDPFTGFPMLVNRRKGLIYSVGQDGKDHDGQPGFDIAAVIPSQPGGFSADGKRGAGQSKTRP